MEKTSSQTTQTHSFSLAEPFGLFFIQAVLNLLFRLQKLSLEFLSLLKFHQKFETFPRRANGEKAVENMSSNLEEDLALGREDMEMVLERMGMYCCKQENMEERMGVNEFSAIFEEKEPSFEEVKEAFTVFDENGDGFIDAKDLQIALTKLGFHEWLELDACEKMIRVHDENKGGRIDLNKFVRLMERSFC